LVEQALNVVKIFYDHDQPLPEEGHVRAKGANIQRDMRNHIERKILT